MWTSGCGGFIRECKWQNLREVTADSFLRWRAEQKKAPKTINEYQAVLSALFTWLRKQNRVPTNPFEIVSKVDARSKESFQRRALNDDEAKRLLATPRKLLYLLAMHTGLRRGEISKLRGSYLHLDSENPFYALPANLAKNRKEQPRPLHPELVAELQKLKAAGKVSRKIWCFLTACQQWTRFGKILRQRKSPCRMSAAMWWTSMRYGRPISPACNALAFRRVKRWNWPGTVICG